MIKAQHRQRQRRLGHLGQRGLERPRQHRRRRQQGAGQRSAPSIRSPSSRCSASRSAARAAPSRSRTRSRPTRSSPTSPSDPSTEPRRDVPLHRHRQRQLGHVPVLDRRRARSSPCASRPLDYERPRRCCRPHLRGARRRHLRQRRPDAGARTPGGSIPRRPASRPRRRSTPGPDLTTVKTTATLRVLVQRARHDLRVRPRRRRPRSPPCTSPKSYTGLAVGVHTFHLRATDLDGNVATSTVHVGDHAGARRARRSSAARSSSQSVKVLNDLIDCQGNGLVIGTGKITLDLNGHIIDGKGLDAGVVNMGFDSVTITNGTINEFDYGVLLNPGTGLNVVTGVHVELNQEAGIAPRRRRSRAASGNIIRGNTIVVQRHGHRALQRHEERPHHRQRPRPEPEGRHPARALERQPHRGATRSPARAAPASCSSPAPTTRSSTTSCR